MENNKVKNPNEANQLAIYKRGRGFELGTMKNKSRVRPEIRASGLLVQRSTARPRYLLLI